MPIAIETAGLHPSTELCIEALQWLHEHRDFHNILDMGCGNGILSLVAASAWDAPVLGADISEKAIADATGQIAAHGLESLITPLRSDGFLAPAITEKAPYDLIICNMLAEFTTETALKLKSCLAEGGIALLAGILAWKADTVINAYTNLGFEIIKQFANSPWQCYVMCHKSDIQPDAIVTKP